MSLFKRIIELFFSSRALVGVLLIINVSVIFDAKLCYNCASNQVSNEPAFSRKPDKMDQLTSLMVEHEGLKNFPYLDTVNKLTIGIGRNLTDRGISVDEAVYLYTNDINESRRELSNYDWYNQLDQVRKDVIVELHFNIGLGKVLLFRQMIASLAAHDYSAASMHLLNSLWAKQVKENRANNMASRLKTGKY